MITVILNLLMNWFSNLGYLEVIFGDFFNCSICVQGYYRPGRAAPQPSKWLSRILDVCGKGHEVTLYNSFLIA